MDFAVFSPRKNQQMLNQSSPRLSAHKRNLFPTNSPQSNDIGPIMELSSSENSDTYSPSPLSPSSSVTPEKYTTRSFGRVLQASDYSDGIGLLHQKAPNSGSPKVLRDKENIGKLNISDTSEEDDDLLEWLKLQKSDSFTTPKNALIAHNKLVRRSPRSNHKKNEMSIKPNNFYGRIAPVLASNQNNRFQEMRCNFRPVQPSRAKAKLLFEDKPAKKRERSRSLDAARDSKRRKTLFTGVKHAIPKPTKASSPPAVNEKRESIRDKARKITDLSQTPYGIKKSKSSWEYTLRFTKPLRYDEELGSRRKFFKTSVKECSTSHSPSPDLSQTALPKKRKLLDTRISYLQETSPKKPHLNTSDISEMIADFGEDKLQNSSEVEDILLRLEDEDDSEEKKREVEKQMLMNILEDSPNKTLGIDYLSNCTANLDLNTPSSDSGCSRFSLEYPSEDKTPSPKKHLFSIFNKGYNPKTEVSKRGTQSNKKWRGVGKNQLQIDAGQKKFGACQCNECGMIYQQGEAEDETQHKDFHNNLTRLRHSSWKNEKIVGYFGMEYAIVVTMDDPKTWQQKALDVISLVDKSLGVISDTQSLMHNQKVFLYIADKHIVGCMVASPVTRAYKLEGSESDVNLCSQETFSVRCGINRMWTLYSHRRQGIATRLLDTVRRNFMYGHILAKEDIAFSIPTSDGKEFAIKYMDSRNFYVYTGF